MAAPSEQESSAAIATPLVVITGAGASRELGVGEPADANFPQPLATIERVNVWASADVARWAKGHRPAAMTGSADQERDAAVALVAAHGWTIRRTTKRGYLIMQCACGAHQETLHKTPSLPAHFRRKAAHMIATCSRPVA